MWFVSIYCLRSCSSARLLTIDAKDQSNSDHSTPPELELVDCFTFFQREILFCKLAVFHLFNWVPTTFYFHVNAWFNTPGLGIRKIRFNCFIWYVSGKVWVLSKPWMLTSPTSDTHLAVRTECCVSKSALNQNSNFANNLQRSKLVIENKFPAVSNSEVFNSFFASSNEHRLSEHSIARRFFLLRKLPQIWFKQFPVGVFCVIVPRPFAESDRLVAMV